MPKKISPNDARRWLDLYDSGQSEKTIAEAAHRDTRTIKKRIAQARRERDVHAARVELVKNALKQHQDRLLNSVRDIESAIVMPSNDLWRAYRENDFTSQLAFMGSTLISKEGKGWTVHLATEDKPEWGLVLEHLKGDPMWASLNAWERALEAYADARVRLEAKCVNLLRQKTGYKLVELSVLQSYETPFLYYYPTLTFIYQVVLNKALGIPQKMNLEDMIEADKETGRVRYGKNATIAEAPGEEEQCKANILATLEELTGSEEAKKVGITYNNLQMTIPKARMAVEGILLLEMVPGECRVCGRLGI